MYIITKACKVTAENTVKEVAVEIINNSLANVCNSSDNDHLPNNLIADTRMSCDESWQK